MIDELGESEADFDPHDGVAARPSSDPVRRGVLITLAIYLSPVLLLVLFVGGVAMGLGGIARALNRPVSRSA